MRRLNIEDGDPPIGQILALGSHSDDIEIGCGGTLMRLIERHPGLKVCWVILGARDERADEARRSAEVFLTGAGEARVLFGGFRDGFLPYSGTEVKDYFEALKAEVQPDLILTHQRFDLHQDHRLVCELTWNTWRDHVILEYEIPKYDGDFGSPNVFVELDESTVDRKVDALMRHFSTQRSKRWFTEDLFRSVMRLRGMEANSPSRYAEAFFARKLVI